MAEAQVPTIKIVNHWTVYVITLVTLGTLLVAAWQGWNARRHFAASVRPLLTTNPLLSDQSKQTAVMLENVGPGAAIIEWAQVRIEGQESINRNVNGWVAFKDIAKEKGLDEPVAVSFSKGDAIRSEAEVRLVGYADVRNKETRDLLRDLLARSEYRICYCSLIGQCWVYVARLYGSRKTEPGCEEDPVASYQRVSLTKAGRTVEVKGAEDQAEGGVFGTSPTGPAAADPL